MPTISLPRAGLLRLPFIPHETEVAPLKLSPAPMAAYEHVQRHATAAGRESPLVYELPSAVLMPETESESCPRNQI